MPQPIVAPPLGSDVSGIQGCVTSMSQHICGMRHKRTPECSVPSLWSVKIMIAGVVIQLHM